MKVSLVLLPGLLCDRSLWRPRIEGLSNIADISVADPTLVLGRQDALTSLERHREIAATPGATLVAVDDCGHLSTLERPDEVTAALRRWMLDG